MVLLAMFATGMEAADFATERRQMLEEIKQLTAATAAETGRRTLGSARPRCDGKGAAGGVRAAEASWLCL